MGNGTFLGWGRSNRIVPAYDADAQTYFDALGTEPTPGFKDAVNTFVLALKSASIWTKMTFIYLLAHETEADYIYNLVAPATTLTNSGTAPTFSQYEGTTGNGSSSYHDTNYNIDSISPASQNSCSPFIWVTTRGTQYAMGLDTSFGSFALLTYSTFWTARVHNFANFSLNDSTPYPAGGYSLIGSRTASSVLNGYYNGSVDETQSSEASTAPSGDGIVIHRFDTSYGTSEIGIAGVASGLNASEASSLHNAMSAYMTAIAP